MEIKLNLKTQVLYAFAANEPLPSEILELTDTVTNTPRVKAAILDFKTCSTTVLSEIHLRLRAAGIRSIAIIGSYELSEEDTLVTTSNMDAIRFVNRQFFPPSGYVDMQLLEEWVGQEFIAYDPAAATRNIEKASTLLHLVGEEPPL
jgi:hypothetical protein